MKKILLSTFVAAGLLWSCSEGGDDISTLASSGDVLRLSAAQITTRVEGGAWQQGDAIAVTMTTNEPPFTSIGKFGAKYIAGAAGASDVEFTPDQTDKANQLAYPQSGSVNIVAVHPYNDADYTAYPYDLSSAAQSTPEEVDVLYAKESDLSKSRDAVELTFTHLFSKISVSLAASGSVEAADIAGAKVEVLFGRDFPIAGTINLMSCEFTTTTLGREIVMCNHNADGLSHSAIVSTIEEEIDFAFRITLEDDRKYMVTTSLTELNQGDNYTYNVSLNEQEATIAGSAIAPWEEENDLGGTPEKDNGVVTLDQITADNYPAWNRWWITNAEADDAADFDGLLAAIRAKFDSGEGTTTSLIFPNLETMPQNTFSYCDGLAGIYMSKVTEIGELTFYGCYFLESVNLPAATSIGDGAFSLCFNLETINIGYDEQGDHAMVTYIAPNWLDDLSDYHTKKIDLSIGKIADNANFTVDTSANTMKFDDDTILTFNTINAAE